MDISMICTYLLSAFLLASVKAKPQAGDSRDRLNGRRFDSKPRDFPLDIQDRQPDRNDVSESRSSDLPGFEALARHPSNQLRQLRGLLEGLQGSLGGFQVPQSSNGFSGQNDDFESEKLDILGLKAYAKLQGSKGGFPAPQSSNANSGQNDKLESRNLDLLRLEALANLQVSQRGFPSLQSSNGVTGQNANKRVDRALFNAFPGSLNGILAPQGLLGAAPGLIGTNPNLVRGQSGLLGGLPGLVAGTGGLGNNLPIRALSGRSPIGDIMAMASFLTKDELNDMFSQDKNFNFIPVILQDSKEDQEVQNFINFLNKRSENEKDLLESTSESFEKRGQRSLNNSPPLPRLIQQNLLQSGINPLLQSQKQQPGAPNTILPQQSVLQELGINPLLALQSQFQSSHNNIFNEQFLSQGQGNQASNGLLHPLLLQQALLQQARIQQILQSQQFQNNQAVPNSHVLNPLVQQSQQQALQQLVRQGRDSELLREQEISASLRKEHKSFFPRD